MSEFSSSNQLAVTTEERKRVKRNSYEPLRIVNYIIGFVLLTLYE